MSDSDKEPGNDDRAAHLEKAKLKVTDLRVRFQQATIQTERLRVELQQAEEILVAMDKPAATSFAPFTIPAPESKLFPPGWNKPGGG